MHEIYELKEMLMKELEEYGSKGELTGGSLEVIDKLAHAIKNLCKIIEAAEEEEYSMAGGSYEGGMGGSYARGGQGGGRGGNRGGGSSNRSGGSYCGGSYAGGGQGGSSYARGRGRNARRDSMGRYSSEGGGYSRADEMEDMVESIREMMGELPQEVQKDAQKFVQKLEQQMM